MSAPLLGLIAAALLAPNAHAERRRRRAPPPDEVSCVGSCDVFLDRGRYRVIVESTLGARGGVKTVDIELPGGYRFEGVPRERRAPGLLLVSTGIVFAGVGAGLAIGGGAFKSHLSSGEETAFWAGLGVMSLGIAFVPMGLRLYSRTPRLYELSPPYPARAISTNPEAPRRFADPEYAPGEPLEPGSALVDEPRWGLVSAGALTFASAYAIMAGVAVGYAADGGPDKWRYSRLLLPIVGPALVDRREHEYPAWTVYGSMPQLAGALLLLIGAVTPRTLVVPRNASHTSVAVAPLWLKDTGGFALVGSW